MDSRKLSAGNGVGFIHACRPLAPGERIPQPMGLAELLAGKPPALPQIEEPAEEPVVEEEEEAAESE